MIANFKGFKCMGIKCNLLKPSLTISLDISAGNHQGVMLIMVWLSMPQFILDYAFILMLEKYNGDPV